MERSKQTTMIAFNKKVKSPYALQYLQFQERLKGGKKEKQKLPVLQPNARKQVFLPHCDNYLDLAHELINNRQRLWFCEDKENLPTIDSNEEVMNNIKEKISRMKNHSHQNHLHPRTTQHSAQLTREAFQKQISAKSNPNPSKNTENSIKGGQKQYQPAISSQGGLRSRVHSEAMRPPSSGKSSVVTFLQYKKSKRELSIRLRRQGKE